MKDLKDYQERSMFNILKSASKIVFMMLALTSCIAFFLGKLESGDFMILAGMAFSFYFAHKGDNLPYAGK